MGLVIDGKENKIVAKRELRKDPVTTSFELVKDKYQATLTGIKQDFAFDLLEPQTPSFSVSGFTLVEYARLPIDITVRNYSTHIDKSDDDIIITIEDSGHYKLVCYTTYDVPQDDIVELLGSSKCDTLQVGNDLIITDSRITSNGSSLSGFSLDGNFDVSNDLNVQNNLTVGGDVSIGGSLTIPSSESIKIGNIDITSLQKINNNADGTYTLTDNKFYFVRGCEEIDNKLVYMYGIFYNSSKFVSGRKALSMIQTTANHYYIYAYSDEWKIPHKVKFGHGSAVSSSVVFYTFNVTDVYELPLTIGMTFPTDNQ